MTTLSEQIVGKRVRVWHAVPRHERPGGGTMETSVEGVALRVYQGKTGSWFAHAPDKKVWLDRLDIRKDSGELVTCNLDQHTQVEVIGDVDAEPAHSPAA